MTPIDRNRPELTQKSMSSITRHVWTLAIGASLIILAFAFQGSRGIFAPDEGFYVSIAQSMSETRDFLIPRLHQQIWLDKPPLTCWGIAAGMRLFGQNEWGARAFCALCFVLTILLVFLLGRSLSGRRAGLLAAVVYATMAIPYVAANIVTPDTPLTLWTIGAFFSFWQSVKPDARHPTLWKMLLFVALGLGFLTKGPAVLVPLAAMLVFLVVKRRSLAYLFTLWTLLGLVLFGAIGLTWYAWVANKVPGALGYFLDNQVLGRTVSAKYSRNPGPEGALIYLPVVLLGTLPWSLFWVRSLRRGWRKLFTKPTWVDVARDPAKLFLAVWIAFPLLIFSVASSKLPFYLLPIFPALAIATARLVPQTASEGASNANPLGFSRWMMFALGLWITVLVGLKLAAAHCPSSHDMRALHASIEARLPDGPFEIIAVDEHLEGLSFYDAHLVEAVTTRTRPYPFFTLPEHLDEEVAEAGSSDYCRVFICRKEDREAKVRKALHRGKVPFQESALPFERYLFVCPPGRVPAKSSSGSLPP